MHRPKCIGPLGFETLPIRHKNNNSTDKGQEISEEFFLVFNCSEKQKNSISALVSKKWLNQQNKRSY